MASKDFLIINGLTTPFLEKKLDINWFDFDKSFFLYEKGNKSSFNTFLSLLKQEVIQEVTSNDNIIKVLTLPENLETKNGVQDFVNHFNSRFNFMKNILLQRREIKNILSVNKIKLKKEREEVSTIVMIRSKQITKNNNIMLSVEDPTGQINILINKTKSDLYNFAMDLQLDEVIAIIGVNSNNIIFANNVLIPDIPINKELKKSPDESYVIFLSDLHIGSTNFLQDKFERFLKWLNQETGNEKQKELASKIQYIFIVGDLVDGVGIYPGQEEELVIKDIYQQYEECTKFLSKIPERIKVIICPGNHDAIRIAEPQPILCPDFAASIHNLKNTTLVGNPSIVNFHSSENFPGFDVFLYHGYSFVYYSQWVESIKSKGGMDRVDLIMKYLLQRRHLAPSYSSTLYIPTKEDCLMIKKAPDFFITGHVHKASISNYRNITMICGSCWQERTSFEEKLGLNPEPGRVPIVNLQTREMKMMRF